MRLKSAALVFVAGLFIAGAATAVPASLAAHRPAMAPAAPVWVVDKAASRLNFRASVSGQSFDGVFKKWDAQIAFDPKNLKASHAAVTVEIASVVTGDPTRDQMLPTNDWFAIKNFPKATFVSNAITEVGPDHYQAMGELRIRGTARPVTLPFTLTIAKDVAKMDGALTLDRSWFGVGQGQFASAETVAREVTVTVRVSAKKAR